MSEPRSNRLSDNGPPPSAAASLYPGSVMHHRMKPKVHRFDYRVFSVLLDLDQLQDAAKASRFFSIDRFNLISFHQKDHGPRDGTCLRRHIEKLLAEKGLTAPHRILLLAYPRLLGYGFNPLSVYYAYDAEENLTAVVYEVRNTFGGLHTYAIPVETGQLTDAGIRQDQRKDFYVSPFLSMQQHYYFRMMPPGESVRVRILEKDTQGPILSATFSGDRKPFQTRTILTECLRVPFLTFKVMAAIHWEAFKIWRKRVPFHSRPAQNALDGGPDRHNRHAPLASNK